MEKMRFNKNKVLGYGLIILLSLLSIIGGLFFNYNIGFELKEKLWIATFIGALLIMIYNFIQLNLDRKTYRNFLNDNDYFNNVFLLKDKLLNTYNLLVI